MAESPYAAPVFWSPLVCAATILSTYALYLAPNLSSAAIRLGKVCWPASHFGFAAS